MQKNWQAIPLTEVFFVNRKFSRWLNESRGIFELKEKLPKCSTFGKAAF